MISITTMMIVATIQSSIDKMVPKTSYLKEKTGNLFKETVHHLKQLFTIYSNCSPFKWIIHNLKELFTIWRKYSSFKGIVHHLNGKIHHLKGFSTFKRIVHHLN